MITSLLWLCYTIIALARKWLKHIDMLRRFSIISFSLRYLLQVGEFVLVKIWPKWNYSFSSHIFCTNLLSRNRIVLLIFVSMAPSAQQMRLGIMNYKLLPEKLLAYLIHCNRTLINFNNQSCSSWLRKWKTYYCHHPLASLNVGWY